jgi:hypothetical protein
MTAAVDIVSLKTRKTLQTIKIIYPCEALMGLAIIPENSV